VGERRQIQVPIERINMPSFFHFPLSRDVRKETNTSVHREDQYALFLPLSKDGRKETNTSAHRADQYALFLPQSKDWRKETNTSVHREAQYALFLPLSRDKRKETNTSAHREAQYRYALFLPLSKDGRKETNTSAHRELLSPGDPGWIEDEVSILLLSLLLGSMLGKNDLRSTIANQFVRAIESQSKHIPIFFIFNKKSCQIQNLI
jgi:hypothetical protein